jgi:tRNA (uracil-5-)-methyltransferase TRM9
MNVTPVEQKNVLDVYHVIANEFDHTRYNPWDFVREFLSDKEGLFGLDIGCGNGKNMLHPTMVGVDACLALLSNARRNKPHHEWIHSNCMKLPFSDNTFEFAIGISVFHHLSTEERRIESVCEMVRVLKPGSNGLVNFWSYEQQPKRSMTVGDNYVTWKSKKKDVVHHRYYCIYDEPHMRVFWQKVKQRTGIVVERFFNERSNWVVVFTK